MVSSIFCGFHQRPSVDLQVEGWLMRRLLARQKFEQGGSGRCPESSRMTIFIFPRFFVWGGKKTGIDGKTTGILCRGGFNL